MELFTCIFLIQILFSCELYAWRHFNKGRKFGGNLRLPDHDKTKLRDVLDDQWITQRLDQFNPTDGRTWKQRYFVNDKYFNRSTGGPIFLNIGGEGEVLPWELISGSWIDYAKQFGALCFALEHRYYGKSHPTEDLKTENLRYLSSQQALADLAVFIVAMRDKYGLSPDNKWIAFGGSYAGSLAAWLRLKYPHLVHGAVSSSAPLLAKVDFEDYLKIAAESLRTSSEECVNAIKEGFSAIDVLLRNKTGQQSITEKFRLCDPVEESVNNPNDIANLFKNLADNIAVAVQHNGEGSITMIDMVCSFMENHTIGPPIDRLAAVNSGSLDRKCLDYKYYKMIDAIRNTSYARDIDRRWIYQTCTEFGFFQTSSYTPQVFGKHFPVEFFIQQCVDIFGSEYNTSLIYDAAKITNSFYGELKIEVTNVVFVHGSIDPWHALGIIQTVNQNAPAIYIKGTSHCADMMPEHENDPPQLTAARKQIAELIGTWLRL